MKICVLLCGLGLGVLCNSQCLQYYDQTVTAADAQSILNQHNDYRKLIANNDVKGQPRGINLKRMKWDNKLAAAAQAVSDTCVFKHQIAPDSRWPAVGQNLYIEYSTGFINRHNWTAALSSWFDEHKVYTYSNQFSSRTGHYTQLVWADTDHVGCGYTFFRSNNGYLYEKLYTCNYGPAGNYLGEYPYKTGASGCENLC